MKKFLPFFLASFFLALIFTFSVNAGFDFPRFWENKDGTSYIQLTDGIDSLGAVSDKIENAWFDNANITTAIIDSASSGPFTVTGSSPTTLVGDGTESSIGGDLEIRGGDLQADRINEYTSGVGVTADGVLLQDGKVTASNSAFGTKDGAFVGGGQNPAYIQTVERPSGGVASNINKVYLKNTTTGLESLAISYGVYGDLQSGVTAPTTTYGYFGVGTSAGAVSTHMRLYDTVNKTVSIDGNINVGGTGDRTERAYIDGSVIINGSKNDKDTIIYGTDATNPLIYADASTSRVGINKSSASYPLDVGGAINASPADLAVAYRIGGAATLGIASSFFGARQGYTRYVGGGMVFSPLNDNTAQFVLEKITGDAKFIDINVEVNPNKTNKDTTIWGTDATNPLLFLDASENSVGIGTATPTAKLDVIGTAQSDIVKTDSIVEKTLNAGVTTEDITIRDGRVIEEQLIVGDDTSDLYTVSNLHFNEGNATAIVDDSGETWSRTGSFASTSTSVKKFGASAYYSGAASSVSDFRSTSSNYVIGENDFVVDFWFNPIQSLTTPYKTFLSSNDFSINIVDTGKIDVRDSAGNIQITSANGTVTDNTWYHIAVVGYGDSIALYVNGDRKNVWTTDYNFTGDDLFIGSERGSASNFSVYHRIDEFRFSIGTDRGWSGASITIPTGEYDDFVPTAGELCLQSGTVAETISCLTQTFLNSLNNAFTIDPNTYDITTGSGLTLGGNLSTNGSWLSGDGDDEGMSIDSSGNVTMNKEMRGVGSNYGTINLDPTGVNLLYSLRLRRGDGGDTRYPSLYGYTGGNMTIGGNVTGGGNVYIGTKSSTTPSMSIKEGGNVGIGLTSPATTFQVTGSTSWTPSSKQSIQAGSGITVDMLSNTLFRVDGIGGVDITANPQIADGVDGQVLCIEGQDDINTLQFDDGDGLMLAGGASATLGLLDELCVVYNSANDVWRERSRSNN